MDKLFRAMADPTRLRILNLIADQEICVCFFVDVLGEGQPKVSRHLAYLRAAGIVAARRDGKWMRYKLQMPNDANAADILRSTLKSLRRDPKMQRDLKKLSRACCGPRSLVQVMGAPLPARA
jgi:ArsR family transcriptional regulator